MFLSGLLSGALVIFLLCHKERVLETQLSLEVSAGIALGIGLLCGLVTMLVRSVGLFLTGLLLGHTLAITSYHPAGPKEESETGGPRTYWLECSVFSGIRSRM